MSDEQKGTARLLSWLIPLVTLLISVAFSAGVGFASFVTKDEFNSKMDAARNERVNMIEKTMDSHKADQVRDMDRIWQKLDRIEQKLDRKK